MDGIKINLVLSGTEVFVWNADGRYYKLKMNYNIT
jgi:hypothetical protein